MSDRLRVRRGDVTFYAALSYTPRNRGSAHFEDNLSRCLWLSKTLPEHGARWAREHWAGLVEHLIPAGADLLVCPPQSRRRSAKGYYFAAELTRALSERTGVPWAAPLAWADEGFEAAKDTMSQRGHGRKLARRVRCEEDLAGLRVCLVDDLLTTGLTMLACREACLEAGVASCEGIALFRTARTEADKCRRDRLKQRADLRRETDLLRAGARAGRQGGEVSVGRNRGGGLGGPQGLQASPGPVRPGCGPGLHSLYHTDTESRMGICRRGQP
jgi:adenine/guanine phosphoribosyltransferase-like PRPP-binding protein